MLYRLAFYDPEGARMMDDYDRMTLIREDVAEAPAVRGYAGPEVDQFDPPSFTYRYPTALVEWTADYAQQFTRNHIGTSDDGIAQVLAVIQPEYPRRCGYPTNNGYPPAPYAEPCSFLVTADDRYDAARLARLARVTIWGTPACGY